ncbi:MAG: dynamin family protein, partial [Waterburya sp.]
ATLNRVTYGVNKFVKVIFKDGREEEVGIERLKEYVTKLTEESEKTAANVKEAVVYYPVNYCQNNVDIIDTPGLNDEEKMDEVTLAVLPEVDAAIMVIMALAPFSSSEREFLETKLLNNDLGRIIFLVTGIDRYNNPEDIERGIESIKKSIQKHVMERAAEEYGEDSPEYEIYQKKIGTPMVYGISAYQALQAKAENKPELMAESRFTEFEAALEKFLTEERGAVFLQVPINRAICSASEILSTIKLQENALSMKQEEFDLAYDKSMAEIEELRQQKNQEIERVNTTTETVKSQVKPLIWDLGNKLKQSAVAVVDTIQIRPAEIANQRKVQQLCERLGKKVSHAVEKTAKQEGEKIQQVINTALLQEVEDLNKNLLEKTSEVLKEIKLEFSKLNTSQKNPGWKEDAIGLGMSTLIPISGAVYVGYKEGGAKGALISGATGLGITVLAISMGMSTLPVLAVVGIVSYFTGGKLTKVAMAQKKLEEFKAHYKEQILRNIEQELAKNHIEEELNTQIEQIFAALTQKMNEEVDSVLVNTENKLIELRAERERHKVMSDQEIQELQRMRTETEQILGHAQGLSKALIQKINLQFDEEQIPVSVE